MQSDPTAAGGGPTPSSGRSGPVVDLRGRVVVVTGGNSGIGFGMARGAARAGADVAVWARRVDRNAEAVARLEALGVRAIGLSCDVSREEDVVRCMGETTERLGRLDALVANAGVSGRSPFVDMTLEEWRRVIAVNLDGAFLCLREAARVLVDQGQGGALVAVASLSSIHGAPANQHYAASKTGLLAVIRGLAVELARHGIRCNSILPGWTETEMTEEARRYEKFLVNTTNRTPIRRWGTPDDFEAIGAFLCDPTIPFHTGDAMAVDGGYSIF